ncbi:tetratricopeptide repeat protein [Sphingomicrobium nitratireducens]|uniref:tetratricopeptide repeat protein n=1 Tax=Sphingomicrobium nitratireducens TaxID=2964666 RepID=UPI00223FBD7E|nr:tetratricopeptide repeat protein [Sphingomicrobium nitratireducens]
MKFPMTAVALALAGMTMTAAPSAAFAQDEAAEAKPQKEYDLSKKARAALFEMQAAITAKEWDKLPALSAAAKATLKTNDDKYVYGQMMLKAASDQKDNLAALAALDEMAASGAADMAELLPIYVNLGKIFYNADDLTNAEKILLKSLEMDPNNSDALITLAETRNKQQRPSEAVKLIAEAIAKREAAQTAVDENWYKRAVALAYEAEDAQAIKIGQKWVGAYPSAQNWRDALRIYLALSNRNIGDLIDVMRLQAAVDALNGENDYYMFADELLKKGYPGEALVVLNNGFGAGNIDRNKVIFKDILSRATSQADGDRAGLEPAAKKAMSAAEARQAMVTGDAFYGYGEYQKAADLYRAALGKTGVDANLANLRLGMALARMGDVEGARTALREVQGPHADTAAYWMVYLDTRG